MKVRPFIKVPIGSRLLLDGRQWLVTGKEEDGYAVEGIEDGECTTLSFARIDDAIRARDCDVIKPVDAERREALLEFTGGYELVEQASDEQQAIIKARLPLVLAMNKMDEEGMNLTQRNLSAGQVRAEMLKRARELSGDLTLVQDVRAGKIVSGFSAPLGRTLKRYQGNFNEFGGNPVVLMDMDHKKGPQGEARCKLSTTQLKFIEYVINRWQDARKPKLAPLVRGAMTQFIVPNEERARGFRFPSITTIRAYVKAISETLKAIGRSGVRQGANLKGAGSTDERAFMFGEKAEIDQVFLSIFTDGSGTVRARELDPSQVGEELEEYEIRRLWLHCMFDIATRMCLAWVIAESADADHSLALLRMATRDKTREKVRYGCKLDPAPPAGLLLQSADNGSATRNGSVYAGQLGAGAIVMPGRTYHAPDKPFVERPFGTLQWQVLNFLPGYAGSRPGELEGYDPKASAKLTHDQLYGTITRFFVDEYSRREHHGTGMFKATPWQKFLEVLDVYGGIEAPSQRDRRIHLGVKRTASTTSEGVKIFNLPFNSTELQRFAGGASRRVTVHLDPDDLRHVSVTAEGHPEIMTARLSMTALSDLTLEEALDLMEQVVKGNPGLRALHNEQFQEALARRAKESGFFPDSRDPASYRTTETLEKQADRLAQVELLPALEPGPTVSPGRVMDRTEQPGVYKVRKSSSGLQPTPTSSPDAPPHAPFKPIKDSKL